LLAEKYGYSITIDDFNYDKNASTFGLWFKESKINPLK
tara:strand:+ start:183 stop:296 length:114 start_codon:yes stop_codon:yes gene_type:complete